jgi:hypothetical protein
MPLETLPHHDHVVDDYVHLKKRKKLEGLAWFALLGILYDVIKEENE